MNTPEKIYIRPRNNIDGKVLGEFLPNELSFCDEEEPKLANYVEYIAKSEAEKMAKEFALHCIYETIANRIDFSEQGSKNINELFTEFINSR